MQIRFLSENLHEAKEDFEKCISLNDSFIPARIQLAYCIYKSAALQQSPILAHGAVDMLQKTVEKYPESADAHSLYAQVCVRQGLVHLANLNYVVSSHVFFKFITGASGNAAIP